MDLPQRSIIVWFSDKIPPRDLFVTHSPKLVALFGGAMEPLGCSFQLLEVGHCGVSLERYITAQIQF